MNRLAALVLGWAFSRSSPGGRPGSASEREECFALYADLQLENANFAHSSLSISSESRHHHTFPHPSTYLPCFQMARPRGL